MDAIEEYFQGEYITEKNKINEIDELVSVVLQSLTAREDINGWPYRLSEGSEYNKANSYSTSTNSMILFVLAKLNGSINKDSSLLPEIEWDYSIKLNETIKTLLTEAKFNTYIRELNSKCNENLLSVHRYKSNKTDNNGHSQFIDKQHLVESNTFGANDPFTLSWIAELTNINELKNQKSKLIEISKEIIDKAFKTPTETIFNFDEIDTSESNKLKNNRFPSNHIFPLLRTIQLFRSIKKDLGTINIQTVLIDLQNRINQQISHFTIQNSLFDTAELVMSLEGLLLLDENRRIDEILIRKVFDILEINQNNNLNWRPLKPFVTSLQGDVLLPLSIEIANSLLRICKLLEKRKQYYFHDYAIIFNKYTQWLLANVSQCTIGDITYKGWRSEHVQEADVIHPWETAQVLTYLMTYKSMIQERIAHKSLKKCGLTVYDKYVKKNTSVNSKIWTDFFDTDINLGYENSYKDILNKFILEREKKGGDPSFSMLLYGPPGTGKSTIAEQLANAINWRLITITPSDFINHGEADIEGRAKSIFKTLEEQQNCVILFDEIDRLILDRDSNFYLQQGDFYQFMTPSMLVKFKDLRTKEKSIFVVATNYAERIDSAIKRSGRIDEKYLINTLNAEQRENLIAKILKKHKIEIRDIKALTKESCFFSYVELSSLVKSAIKESGLGKPFERIFIQKIKTNPPTIKLSNYKRRFQEDINVKFELNERCEQKIDSAIYPYKEFIALVYLKVESGEDLNNTDLEIIQRIKQISDFIIENYFSTDTEVYKKVSHLF